MTALRGETPDRIPFTCYENLLPRGAAQTLPTPRGG